MRICRCQLNAAFRLVFKELFGAVETNAATRVHVFAWEMNCFGDTDGFSLPLTRLRARLKARSHLYSCRRCAVCRKNSLRACHLQLFIKHQSSLWLFLLVLFLSAAFLTDPLNKELQISQILLCQLVFIEE